LSCSHVSMSAGSGYRFSGNVICVLKTHRQNRN
jgi:hypothetical protein